MNKALTKKARVELAKSRLIGTDPTSAEIFLLANKLGITSATIEFSGCGDSGDFYSPEFEGGEPRHVEDAGGNWVANPKFGDPYGALEEALKKVAENWVNGTGVDWYNNDGGGGSVAFNFQTGEVSANIYYYEQVRHEADAAQWNLLDDNEGEDE